MIVPRQALKPGWILAEDVFVHTAKPIMRKQTVLTDAHIDVLEAFFIDEVSVATKTAGGEDLRERRLDEVRSPSFLESYLQIVDDYRTWFHSWRSGARIDSRAVRTTLTPLLTDAVDRADEVFALHHYAKEEDYLFHHAVSVAIVSAFLAKKLSYSKGEWIQIGVAGALCDCGMARLSSRFFRNKEELTSHEREEMKKHPVYSYEMLKAVPGLKEGVLLAVSQHHERVDGGGYPLGIRGEQLHPYSKIVAVADSFHAMACNRPHKERKALFHVLEMLTKEVGKFDRNVLDTLTDELVRLSTGARVRLTNGQFAEIVSIPPHDPANPIVRIKENDDVISLADNPQLFVDTVIT